MPPCVSVVCMHVGGDVCRPSRGEIRLSFRNAELLVWSEYTPIQKHHVRKRNTCLTWIGSTSMILFMHIFLSYYQNDRINNHSKMRLIIFFQMKPRLKCKLIKSNIRFWGENKKLFSTTKSPHPPSPLSAILAGQETTDAFFSGSKFGSVMEQLGSCGLSDGLKAVWMSCNVIPGDVVLELSPGSPP